MRFLWLNTSVCLELPGETFSLLNMPCVLSGRIRNKAEVDDGAADAVLSLNIISAKNIKSSHNSNRYPEGPLVSLD